MSAAHAAALLAFISGTTGKRKRRMRFLPGQSTSSRLLEPDMRPTPRDRSSYSDLCQTILEEMRPLAGPEFHISPGAVQNWCGQAGCPVDLSRCHSGAATLSKALRAAIGQERVERSLGLLALPG